MIDMPIFFKKIWESDIIYDLIGYGIIVILILCILILIKKYYLKVFTFLWKKWILNIYLDKNGTKIYNNKNTELLENIFNNIEKK